MGGVRLVHSQPHFFRVDEEPSFQEGLIGWIRAKLFLLFLVCLVVSRILELALQNVSTRSRARINFPSDFRSSSAFLIVRSGTAPYMEYCVSG